AADTIVVTADDRVQRHRQIVDGWQIEGPDATVRLAGRRAAATEFEPLVTKVRPLDQRGVATWVDAPPALDGTLDGFDLSHSLALDHEDQYRRSEEPYAGPEQLAATAWVNWDDEALYVAVEVTKPDGVVFRPHEAPALRLDNDPDDIHSDGLQVYLAAEPGSGIGVLVVPEETERRLRVHPVGDAAPALEVRGDWSLTESGYCVTLAIKAPTWDERRRGERVGFDLIVNEMRPDRERRAGQLVWSGRGGWVFLRGDRQPTTSFGELELA
ncbi:MAG: Heparinase family protein, partial [Geminicoccaceae bacterium]|nr:Heparinase family protein [Geminicoccaceae bacterium]